MIDSRFKRYDPYFGKWHISRELGKGSFGQVFEICWEDDFGNRSKSAMKVMHIPTKEALRQQREIQPNAAAVKKYFARQVGRIRDEIRILQRCKGHSNIVSYEDHIILESPDEDGIGWDILIRMELLYPIHVYLSRSGASQLDVIRLWRDIAGALIYCDKQGIIHRDIKPDNILVSDRGTFKLSDFGAARRVLQDGKAVTRIGTERYMAPEVYKGEKYDKRADYYSLGCVVFYLLSVRRHPFMPFYTEEAGYDDFERALGRRIKGEKIPEIPWTLKEVNRVLLRSMAYRPQDRYKSAAALYKDIRHILETEEDKLRRLPLDRPVRRPAAKKQTVLWIGLAGALLAGAGILFALQTRQQGNAQASAGSLTARQTEVMTEECSREPQMMAGAEPGTKTRTEIMPAVEPETETHTEIMPAVEPGTETHTEMIPAVEPETGTRTEIMPAEEGEPEYSTEPAGTAVQPEIKAEMRTELQTDMLSETVHTEMQTEIQTEIQTEPLRKSRKKLYTETQAETGTILPESEPGEDTGMNASGIRENLQGNKEKVIGGVTRAGEGGITGWILADGEAGEISAEVIVTDREGKTYTQILEPGRMPDTAFADLRAGNLDRIDAVRGYEIKERLHLPELAEGECRLQLLAEAAAGKEPQVLCETSFVCAKAAAHSISDPETETENVTQEVIINEEEGYVLGLDPVTEEAFSPRQIVLTGWIRAKVPPSLSAILSIDGDGFENLYDIARINENAGALEIIRVPRSTADHSENRQGEGTEDQEQEETGIMINLDLPFLADGEHRIGLRFTVNETSLDPIMVTVRTDSTIAVTGSE